jgi:hypothetical protein
VVMIMGRYKDFKEREEEKEYKEDLKEFLNG